MPREILHMQKNLFTVKHLSASLVISLLACFSLSASAGQQGISLLVPEASNDGSFLVQVCHQNESKALPTATQMELWRSIDGGEYELISTHPKFDAVSQTVYRQGTYAYKAKLVTTMADNSTQVYESGVSYINVQLRYPSLASVN